MKFLATMILFLCGPALALPVTKTKMMSCESIRGKYIAEIYQIRGDSLGTYFEVTLSEKPGREVIAKFPGGRNSDGTLNFRNFESSLPGYEQSFEIEKGNGLWTRAQNLDSDLVLPFSCN
jgi:hypothetical protein